jgi:hypothetical protein
MRRLLGIVAVTGLLIAGPAPAALARGHGGSRGHGGHGHRGHHSGQNAGSSRSGGYGSPPPARYYYYGSPSYGYSDGCGPSGCTSDGRRYGEAEDRNSDYRAGYRDGYRDGQADQQNQPTNGDGSNEG